MSQSYVRSSYIDVILKPIQFNIIVQIKSNQVKPSQVNALQRMPESESISSVKYTTRDLILYAAGIGCTTNTNTYTNSHDQCNKHNEYNEYSEYSERRYLYEQDPSFQAFPLFPLALSFRAIPIPTPKLVSVEDTKDHHSPISNRTSQEANLDDFVWGIQPFPPYTMNSNNGGIGPLPSHFLRSHQTTHHDDDDDDDDDDDIQSEKEYPVIHISQSISIFHNLPVPYSARNTNTNKVDPPITLQLSTKILQVIPKAIGTFVITQTNYYYSPPPSPTSKSDTQLLLCTAEACTLILSLPPQNVLSYPSSSSPNSNSNIFQSTSYTQFFQSEIQTQSPIYTQTIPLSQDQAILYRLSGDSNSIHVDPTLSQTMLQLENPILHGNCTLGIALRSILQYCHGNRSSHPSLHSKQEEKDRIDVTMQVLQMYSKFTKPVEIGSILTVRVWSVHPSSRIPVSLRERLMTPPPTHTLDGIYSNWKIFLFQVWNNSKNSKDTKQTLVVDQGLVQLSYDKGRTKEKTLYQYPPIPSNL